MECPRCEGKGRSISSYWNRDEGEHKSTTEICSLCAGYGEVKKVSKAKYQREYEKSLRYANIENYGDDFGVTFDGGEYDGDYYLPDSGRCFISTMIVNSLGKDDNCEELTILRSFRDNYLLQTKEGSEMVNEYYSIAPDIVQKLKAMENPNVYQNLYLNHILSVIGSIQCNDFSQAVDQYKAMIEYIETL